MELPEWTDIVKTAIFKELAPYDPDWYYIRATSIARKIYLRGGLGVGGFQRIYGGRKRNGNAPPHFCKASGGIVRHTLQQFETMKIFDMDPMEEDGSHPMVDETLTKLLGEPQLHLEELNCLINVVFLLLCSL